MQYTSRGILLHQTPYSETSLIVKIYTETLGLQSFILKGAFRKGKNKASWLFPLALLEITASSREIKNLQYLNSIQPEPGQQNRLSDMAKSSVFLFLNEMIYKSIREEEPNRDMFTFLHRQLEWLTHTSKYSHAFPIWFLIQFSRYLGFFPAGNFSITETFFDMSEGKFLTVPLDVKLCIEPPLSSVFSDLLTISSPDKIPDISLSERRQLIDAIVLYYRLHLSGFPEVKSLAVLQEIWNG